MSTQFQLNPRAQAGFSEAAKYDAYRPTYPEEAVTALLKNLDVTPNPNAKIVELGSGTGKFTSLLAARPEEYEILAVEPHDGMRSELEKKLSTWKGRDRVKVVKGNAEHIETDDASADAVIASQSFHWFANVEALREIHRVLKVAGAFGMIWNIEDYNAPADWPCRSKWEQTLRDILASLSDGETRFRDMAWKRVFEEQPRSNPLQTIVDQFTGNLPTFSIPLGEQNVSFSQWLDDEAIWSRFATLSQIAVLEGEKRESVRSTVLKALKEEGVERNEKGEVEVHGQTYLAWSSRV